MGLLLNYFFKSIFFSWIIICLKTKLFFLWIQGIELLVDKVVGCVGFTVAEAMRKVLEAIAGGILLPGSCGISDPCEREPTDATGHLTIQQRADITASAQVIWQLAK